MPVAAVADSFVRAARSAGVVVQAVLDGVPGKRRAGEFLGGRMDLAGPKRPIRGREYPDHCLLNSAGPAPDFALKLGLRRGPGCERAGHQMRAGESFAVRTCPVSFHPLFLGPIPEGGTRGLLAMSSSSIDEGGDGGSCV